jgi:hypothetical protein
VSKPPSERRQHERRVVSVKGEILEPALGEVVVYTHDLSESGAFILFPREKCPPLGSMVTLRLFGMFADEGETVLEARVVRVTGSGFALQFFDFSTG